MFPVSGHQDSSLADITLRLNKIEERRKLALSVCNTGIWDWDIKQNKLVWDSGMLWIYNLSTDDFGGNYHSWANLVHPDDLLQTEKSITRCLEDKDKEYFCRFRIKREDKWRVVTGFGNCMRDESGKAIRMVGINILEPDVCSEHVERSRSKTPCEICPSRFSRIYDSLN